MFVFLEFFSSSYLSGLVKSDEMLAHVAMCS